MIAEENKEFVVSTPNEAPPSDKTANIWTGILVSGNYLLWDERELAREPLS